MTKSIRPEKAQTTKVQIRPVYEWKTRYLSFRSRYAAPDSHSLYPKKPVTFNFVLVDF